LHYLAQINNKDQAAVTEFGLIKMRFETEYW
jgi:hypothetical protein